MVEDDEFKAADLGRLIEEFDPSSELSQASSVTSALRALTSAAYDIVVLDMSLPTFDLSGPGGGGSPQGQGGIEVLRLAKKLGCTSFFVIVTQYPDIEIGEASVPLPSAARALSKHFSLSVNACVSYEFDRDDWRKPFREFLFEASMLRQARGRAI